MFCVPKNGKNETETINIENKNCELKPMLPTKANENKSSKIKKNVKKKKDPEAPKKPASAFLMWSMDERAKLKEQEEFSQLSWGDLSKELGKRWNTVDPDIKEMYLERYKAEKNEYKLKIENYKPSEEFQKMINNTSSGKIKRIKDANAPKRPSSAFLKWSSVERGKLKDELEHLSMTDKSKELGRRWGNLTSEEKQIYQDMYIKEKTAYHLKMQDYKPSEEFLKLKAENKFKVATNRTDPKETGEKIIDRVEPYFKYVLNNWRTAVKQMAESHLDVSNVGPLDVENCLHQMWGDEMQKLKSRKMKRETEPKKTKDPNAPKKPLNAFQIFRNMVVSASKQENAGLSNKDMTTIAADNWKTLGELDRAIFFQKEEADKERYKKEMVEYNPK